MADDEKSPDSPAYPHEGTHSATPSRNTRGKSGGLANHGQSSRRDAPAGKSSEHEPHAGRHGGDTQDDGKAGPSGDHGDGDDPKEKEPERKGLPWYRRPAIAGIVILVVIVAVVGGVLLWRHSRSYESTDDAFIDVPAQRVSPQVAGRVLRVLVNDNEDVIAGQTLVEIDPADFQNRLVSAQAGQAQAEAQVAEAEAQEAAADAQRGQAVANATVAEARDSNATDTLARLRALHADSAGAVSQDQLDRAVTEADSTEAQRRAAQRGVAAAEAQVNHATQLIVAAHAAVRSAAAQVAQAGLTLSYTQIKASVDGRIARKTVAPGNMVAPGAELMAVVPRSVYVTANFKETQLAHLRRGQPVKIKVDPYPDLELRGRVDSVQPATGQVFDLLPSQNASGNWVKVVQRIPVKITLDSLPDDPDRRLAPGMSVTVTVSIR
jgi:membrane fusion protein (multidrug efflux system)